MYKLLYFFLLFFPASARAAEGDCLIAGPNGPILGTKGVLVDCIPPNTSFFGYLNLVMKNNTAILIAAAVILVVFSGVQYMLALGSTSGQTAAKQRIIGIVVGIIFFTLLRFTLSILSPSLNP